MDLSRTLGALAVIAAVCVLTIFFFPAMQGPYSVVHGPVTALLAARAAAGLRTAIGEVRVVRDWLSSARVGLARSLWAAVPLAESPLSSLSATCSAILRC